MTKQFEFSSEIIEEFNYQRYNHLAPLVQRRMDAIRFKAYGMLHKEIAEIIGITENTLLPADTWMLLLATLGAMCIGMSKAGLSGTSTLNVVLMAYLFGAKQSVGVILPT